MKKTTLFIFIILILFAPIAGASDISVSLNLDRTEATPADSIRLLLRISGARNLDSQPVLRGIEAFNVTRGGTSSRVEIINGKVTSGIDYSYVLEPKRAGSFKIGPAQITVQGRTYQSGVKPLLVKQPAHARGDDRGPLFMTARLSKQEVYLEEQVIYRIQLYLGIQTQSVSMPVIPENPNFTLQQLGKPSEYQSAHQGTTYHVVEIRYALIPLKVGQTVIGPTRMKITVIDNRGRSSRPFDDDPFFRDFFSRRSGRPVTLSSDPSELNILGLPEQGRPPDFTGLVGNYTMSSNLKPDSIRTGESATLTISIQGRGNVHRIPDLKFPELDRAKVYSDQPVLESQVGVSGIEGSKTMKWAIVPETNGSIDLPRLSFTFFDTDARQYRSIRTPRHTLTVTPGETRTSVSPVRELETLPEHKSEVKELGRDIMPIHTSLKNMTKRHSSLPGGLTVLWIIGLPVLIYLGVFGLLRSRNKSEKGFAATRARRAAGRFVTRCKLGELESGEFIDLTRDYLNERFGLSLGSLTPLEADGILKAQGVRTETAEGLRTVLKDLEDRVYSGTGPGTGSGTGDDTCDLGESLTDLIKTIEGEIR